VDAMTDETWVQGLSDSELVQAFSQTGDPMAYEMLKAEQRRRDIERTQRRAIRSERIAVASLVVAIVSAILTVMPLLH
jgi:hypothetical protein